MKGRYLGLTPTRGGNKKVHRKNIRKINDMALIYWSIKYGIEVLDKPKELVADNIPGASVLKHALEAVEGKNIVLLRLTSPIRHKVIIDN